MKLLDQNTSLHFHVPELVLMEQAAAGFVRELFSLEKACKREWEKALILCGSGNNGADGLAIARLLTQQGRRVAVYAAGERAGHRTTEAYRIQKEICQAYGIPMEDTFGTGDYELLIDALFGIGLSRKVEGELAALLESANRTEAWRVAVDISSGVSADSGEIPGAAFRADDTLTFSFGKLGQFLWPGSDYSGQVHVIPMGITKESFLGAAPKVAALEKKDLQLPVRRAHSNKGSYGRLLVAAGSVNMAGAACLCARAAYRSGCGLVRVLTAEENRVIVQSTVPEAVLTTYGETVEPAEIAEAVRWADAVVVGPGLGQGRAAAELLHAVLENAKTPVVLDADALNLLSKEPRRLLAHKGQGWIVTPHIGEMARLTGETTDFLQRNLCGAAEQFAGIYGVVCVLKDFRTVTAVPGGQIYLNLSGNNGMATAGSGDVLAGIMGGLLAQGMPPEDAAMAVYIHGLAGDAAASVCGVRAVTAGDIVEGLRCMAEGKENMP
ncbi:MAG: NAD(P)H-hydrate dehydratase [Blautia sp.]|nr:NAD(P)H-hydrate dehydratase [Blautia sp.]